MAATVHSCVQQPCGYATMYSTPVAMLPCTTAMWLCYHVQYPYGYAAMYNTNVCTPCGYATMCSAHAFAMLPCQHYVRQPCPIVSQPVWHYSKTAIRHLPCRCSFLQPAMNNKTLVFLWATDVLPDKCGHAGQQHAWASQHGPARAVCISVKCTRHATDQHSPSFLPPSHLHNPLKHLTASRPQQSAPSWHVAWLVCNAQTSSGKEHDCCAHLRTWAP
jgi:hypothetical protein